MTLAELGFHDDMVRKAFEHRIPVVEEFEPASDVALLCRCLPILAGGEIAGGVLLVRDVTDLRKRDRLLISKDATIREIHHRVKNNLQTISSLLRLQARRLENPEAKAAVSESVRRIRTIALVHESLSREPGDDVTFIEIVRPLLRLAEESLQSPDRPVHFELAGRRRAHPGERRHAAVGRADRADAERRRPRLPGGQRRRQGRRQARQRRASGCTSRSSTTAGASSRASTSTRRRASVCRSCARSSRPSSTARSRCARRRPPTSPPPASTTTAATTAPSSSSTCRSRAPESPLTTGATPRRTVDVRHTTATFGGEPSYSDG